jgi:hypothetical protein
MATDPDVRAFRVRAAGFRREATEYRRIAHRTSDPNDRSLSLHLAEVARDTARDLSKRADRMRHFSRQVEAVE